MKMIHKGFLPGFLLLFAVVLPSPAQVFTVLYNFTNTPDGANPGGVVLNNDTLFGSASGGGSSGNGLVFSLNTNGTGITPIHSFDGGPSDGASPNDVVLNGGTLYGTTYVGGTNSYGIIFKVGTNGSGYTILRSFTNTPDAQYSLAGLTLVGTMLYGTSFSGGDNGAGTVFKIDTNGANFTVIHSFTNTPDGANPRARLLLNDATLYGTTSSGGSNHLGTVFKLDTNGANYSVIYHFSNSPNAWIPFGGLVLGGNTLYGVTAYGGISNNGAVFKLGTNGTGYSLLHSFTGPTDPFSNSDGSSPQASLTINNGILYGTATGGGAGNYGTLFQISTNGTGFTVLNNFSNSPDGANPKGLLALNGKTIYGFANGGGSSGSGIAFSLLLSPVITAQPQNVTVTNGNPATFNVTATDSSALNYQWYFNATTLLVGQTNATLNLTSATNGNAGNYTVVVSDNFGSVTSTPASLTVLSLPVITAQPQSITVTNGNPATFSVTANNGTLSYQWYFNTNTLLVGQTATNLVIASTTTNDAGAYTVVVTNNVGTVTSSPAMLTVTVNSKPIITVQPQNFATTNGGTANFSVTALGQAPLRYQWYSNNTPSQVFLNSRRLTGKTNATLTFTVAFTNVSYYSVIVSNSLGTATSSPAAMLTVATAPLITSNPQPVSVSSGDPASFTVSAIGAGTLRYQWYFNTNMVLTNLLGNALAGRTNITLAFGATSNSLAGRYSVIVTNTLGKATSSPPALLTISSGSPPIITLQPLSYTITNGDPVTFISAASGTNPLSYQWFFNTNLSLVNATNTTLAIPTANLPGTYAMRVTNIYGAATSTPALLTVVGRPIMRSSAFDPASGSYSFSFVNLAGSTNRLWATTNLADASFWNAIATNIMVTNGLWFFTDTNTAQTNALRFYRFSTP